MSSVCGADFEICRRVGGGCIVVNFRWKVRRVQFREGRRQRGKDGGLVHIGGFITLDRPAPVPKATATNNATALYTHLPSH